GNGNGEKLSSEMVHTIELGLNHSYNHQARTMDIHQQYLSQQQEYTKLITTVLAEQGKVLDNGNGQSAEGIIGAFQRSLDNFHNIREKGMEVHQQFLNQQASYSESYVRILENQHELLQNGRTREKYDYLPEKNSEIVEVFEVSEVQESTPIPDPSRQKYSGDTQKPDVQELPVVDQAPVSSITTDALSEALLKIVGEKTGYPPEMLELGMDLEADLGIDSIKRVEILGALEEEFPSLPPADTEVLAQTRTLLEIVEYMNREAAQIPAEKIQAASSQPVVTEPKQTHNEPEKNQPDIPAKSVHSLEHLTAVLLEIVAEKTGYPVEMLEPDMDMEADLGIDSIKRVEILGAMEERVEGLPPVEAEALAELRTLGQIVEIMSSNQTVQGTPPAEAESLKKKVEKQTLDITPISLISLPIPDRQEFVVDQDRPLVVTDEGSDLTTQFVTRLSQLGWKVLLWQFPANLVPSSKRNLPKEISQVQQDDPNPDSISSLVEKIRDEFGPIAGFIHLHPKQNGAENFPRDERNLVKQVFFIAGSLKADLTALSQGSRSLFLTVTRIDGNLGLSSHQQFQDGGGFSGLVKTLHWEWPDVFCRAIDLDPGLEQNIQINKLLQEIYDPDRKLIEVGLGKNDRVTIKRVYQDKL
ncbi:MAG: phosphopantetheine-binding protein, partial [Anaerolineales bacterium]|nr:phosphopantetheine-binding protein [Anaerolineales bacterium]